MTLPLPASAKDIYFLHHTGGLQEFQLFVRFSVDPSELDSAVDAFFDAHQPTHIAAAPDPTGFTRNFLPMPWWTPDSTSHGYSLESDRGRPFYLWTDPDKHLIFVLITD